MIYEWDTDEGSKLGLEVFLLKEAVREAWKAHKNQEEMINKLLVGSDDLPSEFSAAVDKNFWDLI